QEQSMEPVEECVESADTEDDPVASGRPLWRKSVAALVLVDDDCASGGGRGHENTCAEWIRRRPTAGHERVAAGTEGWQESSGQAQLVIEIAAECPAEGRQRCSKTSVKHDSHPVWRPRGGANIAAKASLAARVIDTGTRIRGIFAYVAHIPSRQRRGVHL